MFIYHFGEDGFFGFLSTAIPLFIIFIMLRNILLVLGGRRPQQPPPQRDEEEREAPPPMPRPLPQESRAPGDKEELRTIIAKMEEKLKAKAPGKAKDGEDRLYKEGQGSSAPMAKQKIRTDKPAPLFKKSGGSLGRDVYQEDGKNLHGDDCAVPHEKGKIYKEAPAWGSEGEGLAAAFARLSALDSRPVGRRVRLKHADLVNGFLLGQILDKPRSLKPYDEQW